MTRAATDARRAAVLGSPIAHSLSPVLHRAAYAELGLTGWSYDRFEIDEAALPGFLDGLGPGWAGLSLTMPLKRAVLPLADSADAWARTAGAANTLVLADGALAAYNTDVPGAREALRERAGGSLASAVVLGGGATAASALLALAELGCRRAVLAVRDPSRAEETVTVVRRHHRAPELTVATLDSLHDVQADVVVSTVPVQAHDERLRTALRGVPVVFDVVYDPWPTPLAADAAASGRTLVSGLDLLAHQAVLQVELMTGTSVEVAVLREAGEQELASRAVHRSGDNTTARH